VKELLHFTADWCQPCKKIKPIIDSYISENSDIVYTQINVDDNIDKTSEYEVRSIPTLIVLTDGQLSGRHHGVISQIELKELINKPA
jgi:thioredoxin 1